MAMFNFRVATNPMVMVGEIKRSHDHMTREPTRLDRSSVQRFTSKSALLQAQLRMCSNQEHQRTPADSKARMNTKQR
jgi:hypothetical protein